MDGDMVFRVIGLDNPRMRKYCANLYNIEYIGVHGIPIPSKLFADRIRTCTRINKEVADIILATL